MGKIGAGKKKTKNSICESGVEYRSQDSFGIPEWEDAAYWFESGGQIIQTIVEGFTEDVRNMSFGDSEKYIPSFRKLREYEEHAFHITRKQTVLITHI